MMKVVKILQINYWHATGDIRRRLFESLFLSGIPLFGYLMFYEELNVGRLISLYISSVFCALAVFGLGEVVFSRRCFLSSALFLFLSASVIFLGGKAIRSVVLLVLIFLNWLFYYILRRAMMFQDLLLHFIGGILQFYFGVSFADDCDLYSTNALLMSLFVSLSFIGGYGVDLVQDVEEDRFYRQKNLAHFLGIRSVFLISSVFFISSYLFLYSVLRVGFAKLVVIILLLIHGSIIVLILKRADFESVMFQNIMVKYRIFYRMVFSSLCLFVFIISRLLPN